MCSNDMRIALGKLAAKQARNSAILRPPIFLGCLVTAPASAETAVHTVAQDRHEASETLRFDGPAVADLVMTGNRVVVASPVDGSAHLAGRRVTVAGPLAGDLFAVEYGLQVSGVVNGDTSVTGSEIQLWTNTGSLRAARSAVEVGAVAGYALITGANVALKGPVAGDVVPVADDLEFGLGASLAGALTVYTGDPATITVPESLATAAGVKIETRRSYSKGACDDRKPVMVPHDPSQRSHCALDPCQRAVHRAAADLPLTLRQS